MFNEVFKMNKEEILKEIQNIYDYMNNREHNNYLKLKNETDYDVEKWCDYYTDVLTNVDKQLRDLIENLTKHNSSFIQDECVNTTCLSHKETNICKIENCINRLVSPK